MWRLLAAFAIAGACGFGLTAPQPAPERVFTVQQADRGRALYSAHCASCHTADLGGRDDAPALTGDGFAMTWRTRTTKDLFDFVRSTMPPEGPTRSAAEYLDLVAYLLQQNGAAAGSEALAATTAVSIGAIATGRRPAPPLNRRESRNASNASCRSGCGAI